MKSTRRSMRNHHGKPSEHAANDPLRIYMPPLSEWRRDTENGARLWTHPEIGWTFVVGSRGKMGYVRTSYSRDGKITFRATDGDVYTQIKRWYAHQTPSSLSRLSERNPDRPPSVAGKLRQFAILDRDRYVGVVDTGNRYDDTSEEGALAQYIADERARGTSPHFYKDRYAVAVRRSEHNPDWSAMREKASHYAGRAAAGARSAYDWTAPRARAAYEWTAPRARAAGHAAWEGTKSAGRAIKRGAKRAAPVIARGAKSAAERMERWAAEPNGRKASGPRSLSPSDIATIKRVSPTVPTSQYAKVVRLSVGEAEVSRPSYDGRGRGSVTVDTASARYIVSLRDGNDVLVIPR